VILETCILLSLLKDPIKNLVAREDYCFMSAKNTLWQKALIPMPFVAFVCIL